MPFFRLPVALHALLGSLVRLWCSEFWFMSYLEPQACWKFTLLECLSSLFLETANICCPICGLYSEETKMKIGARVRMGWQRRHRRLKMQGTCFHQWENLIAEASRKGLLIGGEELQWDTYNILDKQLEQEWLVSVQERKSMPRPKGSKRVPKSSEQRRKIAEAIAAKWEDPVSAY